MKSEVFKKPLTWLMLVALVGLLLLVIASLRNDNKVDGDGNANNSQINDNQTNKDNTNKDDTDQDDTNKDDTKNGQDKNVGNKQNEDHERIDDWVYTYPETNNESTVAISAGLTTKGISADSSLGFSVGGAKDIDNFRQNVKAGYLPSPADISHEGLFYDYFFDTGLNQECDELFCPSYVATTSKDPFSEKDEHFLAVGLNSNIDADTFQRKKLNLVVVLDISGSMSASLDSYYYDQLRNPTSSSRPIFDEPRRSNSKMEAANQSLVALLEHLEPDDRLGIVLFDNQAYVAKQLRLVADTDMEAIKGHILEITPQGGTNMEAGYRTGTGLLDEYKELSADDYENRIIFLTDAMPNIGTTNEFELARLAADNAEDKIYTSFIGIGVDFNAELIQPITQTRGANYFSVHSSEEFESRLDEGFDYMVTPLVFDMTLKLTGDGYNIKAVYGSPEADLASGEIMKVNTLFPSLQIDDQTRGGLVLLHLDQVSQRADLELAVTYHNRAGKQYENQQEIIFPNSAASASANTGIRKGIVLARMVNVIQDWLSHEATPFRPVIDYDVVGIPTVHEPINLSYWERTSRPLRLKPAYRSIISGLRDYIAQELPTLDDDNLERELELLDSILASPAS